MQPNDQQPTTEGAESTQVEPTTPQTTSTTQPMETTPAEVPSTPQPVEATTAEAANVDPAASPAVEPNLATPVTPVVGVTSADVPAVAPAKKRISKKVKLLALVVLIIILLGGASAGAYFGVIVPNKPENVLKSAITNTLKERQINYDGTYESEAADKSKSDATPAGNATFKGGADLDKHTMKTELSVTVTGMKVQGEVRYIDQTAYVKVGDLGAVKNAAEALSPGSGNILSKVENQWIEIDKTLVKQASADCVLDANFTISDQELNTLFDAYTKNQFATITSTSSDTVNGKAATKFELSLNDDKMGDYAKNFNDLSIVKKLKGCSKESDKLSFSDVKDGDTTPLTLWVDKGTKHIVKLASHSTDQDAKKKNLKASGSVTLSYGPVTVEKPANAKPIMTFLSEFAPLFSGGVQGAESDNPFSLLGI